MPQYRWITEHDSGETWAPTVEMAVEDVYAETGEYVEDIWDIEDDPYDDDWRYGGTDD